MSWAEDKAREICEYAEAESHRLVERAIRETIAKCAERAALEDPGVPHDQSDRESRFHDRAVQGCVAAILKLLEP